MTMVRPRPTIADIAATANVSKMTVSRVLNGQPGVADKTRQRILQVMEEAGYAIEPALRSKRTGSKLIALLIPDLTTTYMGEIVRGVSGAAERLDYGLMLYAQGSIDHVQRTNYYLSLLGNSPVDG